MSAAEELPTPIKTQDLLVQTWLLNYENPLNRKLGKEFFKNAPTEPGVYWMLGRQGEMLYIGKAKNLRNRLRSYQRAKPDQAPRKVLRLVYLLAEIRFEICESEKAALLRENALLREHQPPFNVMNTHPETYLYIGFGGFGGAGDASEEDSAGRPSSSVEISETPISRARDKRSSQIGFRFCLSNPAWRRDTPEGLFGVHEEQGVPELFGAFKGRGMIREGYAALLRVLWVALSARHSVGFEIPSVLVRRRVPDRYRMVLRPEITARKRLDWERAIRRFLKGTSIVLLEKLSTALLEVQDIPPFYYASIQDDLETLKEFYAYGPQRNRTLRRFHERSDGHLIAQDEIDDLLVTYRIGERIS